MTPPLCGEKVEVSMKSIMDLKNERVAQWEQAKEFLEAEVALCRLVQDICFKLTQSLDFE